jgi:hypothetical protein
MLEGFVDGMNTQTDMLLAQVKQYINFNDLGSMVTPG